MATIHFVSKCDKSTMTDLEIGRITAIYKDKSEIPACFGFECSSASEGVRAKQNELSRSVDLKLAKTALYLSGSRTAIHIELLNA